MTTNIKLEQLARKNKIDLDYIVFKDELTKLPKKKVMYIIINMASTKHVGTHWVALAKLDNLFIYFDSFGEIPPIEVVNFCNGKVIYNDYVIQHLSDTDCGQLCLLFLGLLQDKFKMIIH